jgi:hypothetical protein
MVTWENSTPPLNSLFTTSAHAHFSFPQYPPTHPFYISDQPQIDKTSRIAATMQKATKRKVKSEGIDVCREAFYGSGGGKDPRKPSQGGADKHVGHYVEKAVKMEGVEIGHEQSFGENRVASTSTKPRAQRKSRRRNRRRGPRRMSYNLGRRDIRVSFASARVTGQLQLPSGASIVMDGTSISGRNLTSRDVWAVVHIALTLGRVNRARAGSQPPGNNQQG